MIKKISVFMLLFVTLTLTGCVQLPDITEENVLTKCPEIISIIESMHKISGSDPYELKPNESMIVIPSENQDLEYELHLNVYIPNEILMSDSESNENTFDYFTGISGVLTDSFFNHCGYWFGKSLNDTNFVGESGFFRWYVCFNCESYAPYPTYLGKFLCKKTIDNKEVSLYLKVEKEMDRSLYNIYGRFAIEEKSYLLCVTYLNQTE